MSQSADIGHTPVAKTHVWKPSALLIDNDVIFGGKSLGFDSPITTTVHVHVSREVIKTSWTGFTIEVPFGPYAEEDGFGMCHGCEWSALFQLVLFVQWKYLLTKS